MHSLSTPVQTLVFSFSMFSLSLGEPPLCSPLLPPLSSPPSNRRMRSTVLTPSPPSNRRTRFLSKFGDFHLSLVRSFVVVAFSIIVFFSVGLCWVAVSF
ncbi:hypothetical protein ABFX02_08G097100 [Erythranthe guttata]